MEPGAPTQTSIKPIYVFIGLILLFTIGFAIILGSSSRADIMAHWSERRCDFDVLMSSFMYKPSSDSASVFEFAANNFNFCVGSKANNYLQTLFGSLFAVLQKQMGAASILTDVMKVMRIQLQKIYTPFSSMMNTFWLKFKKIGSLASRIFQHLYMAMKKAAATATASIFIALSLQTIFLNTMDFVINVIMIVLNIMIGLAFIFFLPLLPVMFFVTMAVNGIESGFPGRTGTMGEVFCFAPDTQVIVQDNTSLNIQDIQLGTILLDGQRVEAVLELPGSNTLYVIDGILVSGDHLIQYNTVLIPVKEHPEARKISVHVSHLWTIVTSNRQIPVRGLNGTVLFSDWEELPNTPDIAMEWDSIVRSVLNSPNTTNLPIPTTPPCFDLNIRVMKYQSGLVPLSSIVQGDWIMGENRWTQVIGICRREVENCLYFHGNSITDGVWMKRQESSLWAHPVSQSENVVKRRWEGGNLITDSGSFKIRTATLDIYVVRDFTEVGWVNLASTYVKERALGRL